MHCHLWVCSHSPRCMPQEMLNVHLEVVIGERAEVLEKFTSELELGGQGKWFLLLKHFPHIGINMLPPMVPLDELFPHGKVFVLYGYHSQLTLDSSRPIDNLPLLLRVNVLESTDDQGYKSLHRRSSRYKSDLTFNIVSTYFMNRCTAWKDLKGWTSHICLEAYRVLGLIQHHMISTSLVLTFLIRRPAMCNPYVAAAY